MDTHKKKIVTHNGIFHADDVFAVTVLREMLEADPINQAEVEVVRTRDVEYLFNADFVVDVGGIYDPSNGRFDHHQKGGAGTRKDGTPYASAGLVWRMYGAEFSVMVVEKAITEGTITRIDTHLTTLFEDVAAIVDASLIKGIDATDNGVTKPNGAMSLSAVVFGLNPTWLHKLQDFNIAFQCACDFALNVLTDKVLAAYGEVVSGPAVESAAELGHSPKILVLPRYIPWQATVVNKLPKVSFVVFPSAEGNNWMVQAAPLEIGGFTTRCNFPVSWAGLQDDDLASQTGVKGAVFCHNGRFIAGATTLEGAVALAEKALTYGLGTAG